MKTLVFIFTFLAFLVSIGQNNREIDLETFAERLYQIQDEDISYEDLYESLFIHYSNPIDINSATRSQLASLYILSPIQLNAFFDYKNANGTILSEYELQAIPTFDTETIRNLLPFISLTEKTDNRPLYQRILEEPNNYLLMRYSQNLEKENGYTRNDGSGFSGQNGSYYGRFRVSHAEDFSLGFTFEKDAGEQITIDKNQTGFDFYSFHFLLKNQGKFKTLALGDFQLQFGQGLVFGSGFGAGKGAETVNSIKRNSLGIRPYASALESGFFRGAASTYQLGKTEFTTFVSADFQDARVLSDTSYSDFEEFVNAIQATGLHRTQSEKQSKNQIVELNTGIAVETQLTHQLEIGATSLFSHFSKPIRKKPNNYNQFEYEGNQNIVSSLYANWNWQNFIFFGETALSSSGGTGSVAGLIASLTPKLDFGWSIRNYNKNFHSFYANTFGETSRNINEKGMYWGMKYKFNRKYQLASYFDKFSFPWLKFKVDAPSDGYEYLARFTYLPSRYIQLYAQYRQENKELSISNELNNLSQLSSTIKRNYIFNIDYAVGRTFSFKSRLQGSTYQQHSVVTSGVTLVQDVNLTLKQFKFSTRFSVFDTDDFNNRQYVYERNVLYAFGIPAYTGTGTRSYLMAQYTANKSLTFWLRYARFNYANTEKIGSGLNEISANHKSEIKVMLRYKFRD